MEEARARATTSRRLAERRLSWSGICNSAAVPDASAAPARGARSPPPRSGWRRWRRTFGGGGRSSRRAFLLEIPRRALADPSRCENHQSSRGWYSAAPAGGAASSWTPRQLRRTYPPPRAVERAAASRSENPPAFSRPSPACSCGRGRSPPRSRASAATKPPPVLAGASPSAWTSTSRRRMPPPSKPARHRGDDDVRDAAAVARGAGRRRAEQAFRRPLRHPPLVAVVVAVVVAVAALDLPNEEAELVWLALSRLLCVAPPRRSSTPLCTPVADAPRHWSRRRCCRRRQGSSCVELTRALWPLVRTLTHEEMSEAGVCATMRAR